MKRLPIDTRNFETLNSKGHLFCDKTEIIYDLIMKGRFYLLVHPEGARKSLFISTLKEVFLGNQEFFKDLWIGKSDYDWQKYPVLYFDFKLLDGSSALSLRQSLATYLDEIAGKYDIDLAPYGTPGSKLKRLIRRLGKEKRVVVLIDEYDFSLNCTSGDDTARVLKSFFCVLKSLDAFLKAAYITAAKKSSKALLIEALNHFNDISADSRVTSLLGVDISAH